MNIPILPIVIIACITLYAVVGVIYAKPERVCTYVQEAPKP